MKMSKIVGSLRTLLSQRRGVGLVVAAVLLAGACDSPTGAKRPLASITISPTPVSLALLGSSPPRAATLKAGLSSFRRPGRWLQAVGP